MHLSRQQPVEDVVVSLQTRLLVRHTRFLQQICKQCMKVFKQLQVVDAYLRTVFQMAASTSNGLNEIIRLILILSFHAVIDTVGLFISLTILHGVTYRYV